MSPAKKIEKYEQPTETYKNEVEHYESTSPKVSSPLINKKNISDSDLIEKLYAQHTSKSPKSPIKVPRKAYSSKVSPNSKQMLINKPSLAGYGGNTTSDNETRRKEAKEMAKQFVSDKKQKMYPQDNPIGMKDYQSFDDTADYMLLSKDSMPDPKFNKVMPVDVRPTLQSYDLLPIEENKDWFDVPNKEFNLMQAVDLEVPEIKIGVDTVGQSRKCATYDIRARPSCPKYVVGPWNNSTIEADYNIKPMC
jgi:hypothetical protein